MLTADTSGPRALVVAGGPREKVVAVRRQVRRVVAAVMIVGAMIGGCGGPSQVGSAVIVGSEAVPLGRVQSKLDVALAKTDQLARLTAQGGGPADLARNVVTREVLHVLLQRRAATEKIVVTDAQVDARLAEDGGAQEILEMSFFDLPGLRQRVRDDLIAEQLARRSVGGLAVTADLVGATSRADAEEKAQALVAGGPAAQALLADRQTAETGSVFDAVTMPDTAGTVLFGTPVGGVVAFQPNPQQSTWIVFRVTDRRTDVPSDPAAVSSISRSQLVTIGERLLQPLGAELGIRVNPRYGEWDPIQQRVVAEGQMVGTILPPAPAATG